MQALGSNKALHELNRNRPLSDRSGNALDRAMADIAGGEHARHARFEQHRVALERPGVVW